MKILSVIHALRAMKTSRNYLNLTILSRINTPFKGPNSEGPTRFIHTFFFFFFFFIIIIIIIIIIKDLLLKKLKGVPLFIRLMSPNGAIWSLDQRTVLMR